MNNPPFMPKKETRALIIKLREIRRIATMETSSFNQEIKDVTRGWRDMWIIYPLDELIERYEKALEAQQ